MKIVFITCLVQRELQGSNYYLLKINIQRKFEFANSKKGLKILENNFQNNGI